MVSNQQCQYYTHNICPYNAYIPLFFYPPRTFELYPFCAQIIYSNEIKSKISASQDEENSIKRNQVKIKPSLANCHQFSKDKQLNRFKRQKNSDPEFKLKQKFVRKFRKQKDERNVIPNLIRQAISFLQQKKNSGQIAKKIFNKINKCQDASLERFYIFHRILKSSINHYVNQDSLQRLLHPGQLAYQVYKQEQQIIYFQMNRIIILEFLQRQSLHMVLTSIKMKPQNKIKHIKIRRIILNKIFTSSSNNYI